MGVFPHYFGIYNFNFAEQKNEINENITKRNQSDCII